MLPVERKKQSGRDDFMQSNHIWHVPVRERRRTQRKLKENNLQVKATYVVFVCGQLFLMEIGLDSRETP